MPTPRTGRRGAGTSVQAWLAGVGLEDKYLARFLAEVSPGPAGAPWA